MSIQTISRKNKELLAVTLLLNVAAIGLYAFLFTEIKAKNEHTSGLINQIEAETKEEQTQNSVKALVAETTSLRNKLKSYTVEKEGAVSFLELLERIGGEVGVSVAIDSVEKSELPAAPQTEQLKIALKADGTWSGIVRFLGLLEFLPYEARVEQVAVGRTATKLEPWRISLSLIVLEEK